MTKNTNDPTGTDRAEELHAELVRLVGVDDPARVAAVMVEMADLGDGEAVEWLTSYRLGQAATVASMPMTIEAVIADAMVRLDSIAGEIESISQAVGIGAGQYMVAVNADEDLSEETIDGMFDESGWTALATRLQDLGESLIAASGEPTPITAPSWARELALDWRAAFVAFYPDSEQASTIQRQMALRDQFEQMVATR